MKKILAKTPNKLKTILITMLVVTSGVSYAQKPLACDSMVVKDKVIDKIMAKSASHGSGSTPEMSIKIVGIETFSTDQKTGGIECNGYAQYLIDGQTSKDAIQYTADYTANGRITVGYDRGWFMTADEGAQGMSQISE